MTDPIFIPAPFFLLRTSISPIEECERLLRSDQWIETILNLFETNELVRESIRIASPSLYQSLQQKPLKDPEQVAASLFNYVLRMSTRATPFGLFSFVSTGFWSQHTDISFESSRLNKRARPDMEWIYTCISKLYENKSIFSTLSVRTNPLVQANKERFSLQYIRYGEKKEGELSPSKTISVRNNTLTQSILTLAKNPITVSALCDELATSLSNLDRQKAEEVIHQLYSQQILLPGILPSLLYSAFDEKSLSLPHLGIEQITNKIELYNELPIGNAEDRLQELLKEMESFTKCSSYLQVDTSYKETPFLLSKEISKQAAEAADILWKISPREFPFERLLNYHSKFLEQYGTHRTVPLLEMLNEEKGLGSFLNSDIFNPKPDSSFVLNWEKWLMKEWQECLCGGKNEIIVNEEVVNSLVEENPLDPHQAPLSFDLFFKVLANSQEQIDKGQFSLLFTQSTFQGGSTWGRFLDLLGDDTIDQLQDFYQREEKLEPEPLFVELSYWPKAARAANVVVQPCFRAYRLDLEAKDQSATSLSIEDIYVGATPIIFI